MEEFVRDEFAMFERVLLAPLIVLFVRIWEPVNVTTVESIEIVPVLVIGPPVNPVPVFIRVTAPVGRFDHAPFSYTSKAFVSVLYLNQPS